MALEIVVQVEGIDKAVESAGYTVIDSVRNEIENGFTSIDESGKAIIPITSRWVEEGEKLRVTIDDFTGGNISSTGSATDWIAVTTVYVDYSAVKAGIYVDCVTETGQESAWDMGDGNFVNDEEAFRYMYTSNGVFTITCGSFTTEITITDVVPFSVEQTGNKVSGIPQSGVESYWDMGDGSILTDPPDGYEYQNNGTYTISFGIYTQNIVVDYFSETLIQTVEFNKVTLNISGEGVGGAINYGDGEHGTSVIHEYPSDGKFLVSAGDELAYVSITKESIPNAGFVASLDPDDPSNITFSGTGGDTYEMTIDGVYYSRTPITHKFAESGVYDIKVVATSNNGNANTVSYNHTVLTANTVPTASINEYKDLLSVNFSVDIIDPDFQASHTVRWVFNKGETYEAVSTELNPTYTYSAPEVENDPDGQTFLIECTVTDEQGASYVASKYITVYDFVDYSSNNLEGGAMDTTADLDLWTKVAATLELTEEEGEIAALVTGTSGSQCRIFREIDVTVGKTYNMLATFKCDHVGVYDTNRGAIVVTQDGVNNFVYRIDSGEFTDTVNEFTATSTSISLSMYVFNAGSRMWIRNITLVELN